MDISQMPREEVKKTPGRGFRRGAEYFEAATMLDHETVNKLRYMKLTGIAEALKEQHDDDAYQEMGFRDRFALLVDREFCKRQHGRLQRLINGATRKSDRLRRRHQVRR